MCTGIFLKKKDGGYVFGRTLEFNMYFIWHQICNSNLIATVGRLPNSSKEYMTDGLNKHGLLVGTFFFPHQDKQYANVERKGFTNLHSGEVTEYFLKNYKSVDSIKAKVKTLNIIETKIDNIPFSMHWIVCDRKGNCGVIEVKNKEVVFYDNPYHVITNSPEFPQHVKNLEQFRFLSPYNKPNSLSEGTGALGLPGDNTSQSRFIRAHFYRENMPPPSNGMEAVLRVLHNFDIPLGSVVDKKTHDKEVTEYTVCYDLNNFTMTYAPYGYIRGEGGRWVSTSYPVNECENTISKDLIIIAFLLISFWLSRKYNVIVI